MVHAVTVQSTFMKSVDVLLIYSQDFCVHMMNQISTCEQSKKKVRNGSIIC